MIEHAFILECDSCNHKTAVSGLTNKQEIKKVAREEGWIFWHKNYCFCSLQCFVDYIKNNGIKY